MKAKLCLDKRMKRTGLLCLLLVFLLGCSTGKAEWEASASGTSTPMEAPLSVQKEEKEAATEPAQEAETVQKNLVLMINGAVVPVIWEENPSVWELSEHAAQKAIQIEMSMYGGWEQVGSLGYSVSRNDVQLTAKNGDIMLYSGNQIVLFYGENSWAYTKLGHTTLPEEEVTSLLSRGAVRITLTVS